MNRLFRRGLFQMLVVVCLTHTGLAQQAVSQVARPAATGSIPRSVAFNGQVVTWKDRARVGTLLLTFGLYTEQRDDAALWTEQQQVTVDELGRYAVILGAGTPDGLPVDAFVAGAAKWLGVQVDGEPEQPRVMLLSVPYALKAGDAETVGGKRPSEFVTASHLTESVKAAIKESTGSPNAPFVTPNALVKYQNSGGTQTESSLIDAGGRLGIGVSQGTLVSDNTELDIFGAGSTTTITLHNGASAADVVKLVGSDGSLRIGSATNANLFNLIGPNIGIGTTTPQSKMEIVSQDALRLTGFQPFLTLRDLNSAKNSYVQGANGDLAFVPNNGAAVATVIKDTTGFVGIGTNAPSSKLDVRGSLTLEAGSSPGLFTGTGGVELNRYLALLNSPTSASASGLKAGGILVADDYSFANPGKNELIVKGNAEQSLSSGGFVKAMMYVSTNGPGNNGTILRCFDGVTNNTSGNCGFTASLSGPNGTYWDIFFPFTISGRPLLIGGLINGYTVTYNSTSIHVFCNGNFGDIDITVVVF